MLSKLFGIAFCTLFLYVASPSIAHAEGYKLSARSVQKTKELKELVADANERQKIANAMLGIGAFQTILGAPNTATTYQIATGDWTLLASASKGLSENIRMQLKQFCELEALTQDNSKDDRTYWRKMAEQFKHTRS